MAGQEALELGCGCGGGEFFLDGNAGGGAPASSQCGVCKELFEGLGQGGDVVFCEEGAGDAGIDHLGDAGYAGGDDGEAGGHGFHDDGREIVAAAFGVVGACEREDAGMAEGCGHFRLGSGSFQHDKLGQRSALDLVPQGSLERTGADDAATEVDAPVPQEGAGGDEIGEAFFLDETADGDDFGRGDGEIGAGEFIGVDAVVNPVKLGGGLWVALTEPIAGEVCYRDHEASLADEGIEGDGQGGFAEHVVCVAREGVGDAVEFLDPIGGTGGNTGKLGVDMADAAAL